MSESGDYTPAPHWEGYDFASARRAYMDNVVARGAASPSIVTDPTSLTPESMSCDSEAPLVIVCDVTGSMGDWPATIFSKLPYLEYEGQEYLGEDLQICFAAVGDATSDKYPLQVQPFTTGKGLETTLKGLIIEGGGGGSGEESYDLAALYFARRVECPEAIRKPILIFIGDEGVYNFIDPEYAERWARVRLEGRLLPETVFEELKRKFSVYVVRKPYSYADNQPTPTELRIQKQWMDFLGADHVVSLPEAARVVDVIFGILARETGRVAYFRDELQERQGGDPDGAQKIDVVLKSLRTIHGEEDGPASPPPGDPYRSVSRIANEGSRRSISLLDDE